MTGESATSDFERILEVGRDPLFSLVYPEQTDWVSTGRAVEPLHRFQVADLPPKTSPGRAVARLRRGDYDLVMVPAIQAHTPTDRHWSRTMFRRAMTFVGRRRPFARLLSRAVGLRHTTHFVRDISDYPRIGDSDAGLFPDSALYAKREVLSADIGRQAHGRSGGTVIYLPMPFDTGRYEKWAVDRPEKNVDVFFAGKLHSHERILAREAATLLAEKGWRVDVPQERLAYDEYLQRLARSWLVLSPKGHGEHCYRHYEALLMGSVPVINRPTEPVHYGLEHNETAIFFYPTVGDIVAECEAALADQDRLRSMAAAGRSMVRDEHDVHAVSRKLFEGLADRD